MNRVNDDMDMKGFWGLGGMHDEAPEMTGLTRSQGPASNALSRATRSHNPAMTAFSGREQHGAANPGVGRHESL